MSKAREKSKENNETPVEAADIAGNVEGGFADLDKVRSILFGAESQKLEQRITHLEHYVEQQLGTLGKAIDKRFEVLEALLKKEHKAFSDRLAVEQQQRADAEGSLSKEIQAVAQALRDNRAQLDEQLAETDKALRTQLDEQARAASQGTGQRFEALTARLEQAVAELQQAKTDRLSLADLFDELSGRLRAGT